MEIPLSPIPKKNVTMETNKNSTDVPDVNSNAKSYVLYALTENVLNAII